MDSFGQNIDLANERRFRERIPNIKDLAIDADLYHKRFRFNEKNTRKVDGLKLASSLGLTVLRTTILAEDIRGSLDPGQRTIYINSCLKNEYLINLTIIHECSHFILKHPFPAPPSPDSSEIITSIDEALKRKKERLQREFEAKYLTSLILLPTSRLLKAFEYYNFNFEKVERVFNVSPTQVMRRLNQVLFEEWDIPTHWVKSANGEFIKHEIYDGYELLKNNRSVTKNHPAFLYAHSECVRLQYTVKRFAYEEKINGKEFVTYVVLDASNSGELICSGFGVPIKYANNFPFYKRMIEHGPSMKPEHERIATPPMPLPRRVWRELRHLVLSSKSLIAKSLMGLCFSLIVVTFTAYITSDSFIRVTGFWRNEFSIMLICALLFGLLSLWINKK